MDLVLTRGRQGVQHLKNLADIICEWPPKGRAKLNLRRCYSHRPQDHSIPVKGGAKRTRRTIGTVHNPTRSLNPTKCVQYLHMLSLYRAMYQFGDKVVLTYTLVFSQLICHFCSHLLPKQHSAVPESQL